MIQSSHGIVDLNVIDYEKLIRNIPHDEAIKLELSEFYADLAAILDALSHQYGDNRVCDMIELYLKEKLKENNND